MHIGIIGTRGIPNNYGGFEQCAEYLAQGLVERGFQVTVYNSHNHPYQKKKWKDVNIVHCYDPEDKIGTAGQFIYDLNCIIDSKKQKFDVILLLGYTSSSVWGAFLPKRTSVITTNMDGLEWKRSKFSKRVQRFILKAEALAIKHSDHLISDSVAIQEYLKTKYEKESAYIPYGAAEFNDPDPRILQSYQLHPFQYNMLIARLEPDNSIDIILEGAKNATVKTPFLVIGKHQTKYGEYLKKKYKSCEYIHFVGGIYNMETLNNLRYFSNLYFHGHTVGGTNPSLLEAMASYCLICAHRNKFNSSILQNDAYYFESSTEVAALIETITKKEGKNEKAIEENVDKIRHQYNWENVIDLYAQHFQKIRKPVFSLKTLQLS